MKKHPLIKHINKYAWTCSISLHILLFWILSLTFSEEVVTPPPTRINITISEIEVKTKLPKPLNKKSIPSSTKSFPGDRKKAIIINKHAPYYPKTAINNGWQGKVTVKVFINTKGRISHIKLIKSSGHKLLDNAFIETIKTNYKFKPKRKLGINKTSSLILSYTFKL